MKKIISILTILMMAVCPQSLWADDWIEVSNVTDFVNAVNTADGSGNYNACIKLNSDIDLTQQGGDFIFQVGNGFKGKIDGQGHELKNAGKPLFYHVENAEIKDLILNGFCTSNMTPFVRTSKNSKFTNITAKNCSVRANTSDNGYNISIIAGYSEGDTFDHCRVERNCSVSTKNFSQVGGIVGYATGSTFLYCYNGASITMKEKEKCGGIVGAAMANSSILYCQNVGKIYAESCRVGGTVGYLVNSYIENCVNSGEIIGANEIGGICGYLTDSDILYSINTGTLNTYNKQSKLVGGILSNATCEIALSQKVSLCKGCWNFGTVNNTEEGFNSKICSKYSTVFSIQECYYYCKVNNGLDDNLSNANTSYEEIMSGKYVEEHYDFSQDIDNNTFCTHFPVKIPSAGSVHKNYLCDGSNTLTYSNIYKGQSGHTPDVDAYGICKLCGRQVAGSIPTSININNADGMKELSRAVQHGADFSNTVVYLNDNIDMEGGSGFAPIGKLTKPFKGTFNGLGHHISNLGIYGETDGIGLFGCVSGENTTIKNVIIDKSCTISAQGSGVAGVVGCVKSTSGSTCNITIQNCGNEATVTGWANSSGILGGVYDNNNTKIVIRNCYNRGNISGSSMSGTICGYARKNYNIQNCYNSGTIAGAKSGNKFYSHETGGTTYVANCYDINGSEGTGVKSITSAKITDGTLCGYLKANVTGSDYSWTQNVNNYPEFDISTTGTADYLCLTASNATDISFSVTGTLSNTPVLQFSESDGRWTDYALGTTISLSTGGKTFIRAKSANSTFSTDNTNYIKCTSTGSVAVSGNIMSLLDPNCEKTDVPAYAFCNLFLDCTNLTSAPKLPATTLGASCYESMFKGCIGLTDAPYLPATTLVTDCYKEMFYGCTILSNVNVLFQSWGENNPYTSNWLSNVSASGTLTCYTQIATVAKGVSTIPVGWTLQYIDNTLTLSNKGYITYSSAVDMSIKTDGVKACKAAIDNGNLVLTELDGYIPAGKGVLIYGTANAAIEFEAPSAGAVAADLDGNELLPTTTPDTPLISHEDAWVLDGDEDLIFVKDNSTTFTVNSAYIRAADRGLADDQVITPEYLCLTNVGDGASQIGFLCYNVSGYTFTYSIDVSKDKKTWTTYDLNSNSLSIPVAKGEKVYFRTSKNGCPPNSGRSSYVYFNINEGQFAASGNVISMIYKTCIRKQLPDNAFYHLFCECTGLTTAPELPFTELAKACYYKMFYGCTSLKSAPLLPATNLFQECYYLMFGNCTSLKSIPDLSHVVSKNDANYACQDMFKGCTGIRVNTIGPGTEWKVKGNSQNNNMFKDIFSNTGGNFTGTPQKDVTYYVLDKPYTRTMNNQWGTICLPFAIDGSGDGYDLYTITSATSDKLNLTKVDGTLAAGKPAIIRRNADVTTVSIPAISGNTDFVTSPIAGSNNLTGTFTDATLTSGYIIANNSFWDVSYLMSNVSGTTSVKCSAFHAYIAGTISSAKELTIGFDDATAVNSVNNEQLTVNNGKYIENGRVVILKNNRKYNLNGQEIK